VYYMVRNHLYVSNKYKHRFKNDLLIRRKGLQVRIKNNLLYGKNKWKLIRSILQAVSDFKNKRMGKKNFTH
jgi:hypothetical protein